VIFVAPDLQGRIADEKWALTFAINVSGQAFVAEEAHAVFKRQGLPASITLTTSDHLLRGLAVELAPLVRVNAVAPATVMQGSAMFPRDRVIASVGLHEAFLRQRVGS
jgi:NAD(P)-dependent dehydrogenase (short-subunit alcohol dehydrogenase family)